ncbi:MAG: N-acetylneuraminate synthase family protein [Alphaproteobacteria bacterium]|nr:N-acetylneuraminate synthase family protein [Alphaproteobacteria bacterium]
MLASRMTKKEALPIGCGNPTFVVAEMAWAHDGSIEKAMRIVDGAADAKADAINLHLTKLLDYMVPFYGAGPGRVSGSRTTTEIYKYLEGINLSFDAVAELAAHAKARGLKVSVMCNDEASAAFAGKSIHPDILMIHPSSVGDERLLRMIAAQGTPLVIYTGALKLGEIETAVQWATAEGNGALILQHGFQSYPTPLSENRLRAIETLKRQFGFPVAFADHTDGDDPMAMIVPLLAIAMGADAVEKHITYDRAAKGEDYESSLDPAQFAVFVDRLRKAESTFGSASWRPLSDRELKYREVVRKRAVAARPIRAGTLLTRDLVAFKRCDRGLYPEELTGLLGSVSVAQDLDANVPLERDLLK